MKAPAAVRMVERRSKEMLAASGSTPKEAAVRRPKQAARALR